MNRRLVPAWIALYLLVCLVAAASVETTGRLDMLRDVTLIYVLVLALGVLWIALRPGSATRDRTTETKARPDGTDAPVVVSIYEPGGGLYYLKNTGAVAALNVFVLGTDASGSPTTIETGSLAPGESRVISQQGLARRDHLVVAEGRFPDARQWNPMVCRRTVDGFYITARAVPDIPHLAEKTTFSAFRSRYLRRTEEQLGILTHAGSPSS